MKEKKQRENNIKNNSSRESVEETPLTGMPVEPVEEVSLEELHERTNKYQREFDAEDIIDTQHSDGSTTNPVEAEEQGLVYNPPSDPPVVPSDDLQGAEVGIGFASSMEASNPDVERLPDRVDNNDLDLEDDISTALRLNSETTNLEHIRVRVQNGVALLQGTTRSESDISLVDEIVRDLEGVVDVDNQLRVSELI